MNSSWGSVDGAAAHGKKTCATGSLLILKWVLKFNF